MALKIEKNEDIAQKLNKLSYYCAHHEFKELKNKIDSKINDLKEPVYVMIVGDGKRGKSTLLNALIGQNLAEVNFLPKTWRIDTYTTTDENEYAELIWGKGDKLEKQKTTFVNAFAICKEIESRQSTRKVEEWKSDLKQINWFIKSKWNLNGRALVDTPGFSQLRPDTTLKTESLYNANGIQIEREDGFSYYYYRADVVFWCIRATKLEDADALDKLKEVHSQDKQIIGIITFMDQIPKDRWDDVKRSAQNVFGKYISKFIFSAAGSKDDVLRNSTVEEIRKEVDSYTLGREQLVKYKEAENFYKHNLNEFENLTRQIASLFTENYIQYHDLLEGTSNTLSRYEENTREKIVSYLSKQKKSLISSLDSLWDKASEEPDRFAEIIKNSIHINEYNSEFEKSYNTLTDNFNAVFKVIKASNYKAIKLGQNKAVEFELADTNTTLVLSKINTFDIGKFDSLGGGKAGASAKQFFGDNLIGELAQGIGYLLNAGKIRRDRISKAEGYITQLFDDLNTQYLKSIDNISNMYSTGLQKYIVDKFVAVNGGNDDTVLKRIYDIEDTLNSLDIYDSSIKSIIHLNSNHLIKSQYITKILSKSKYYFNVYSDELIRFIDYNFEVLKKNNKIKIRDSFDKIAINIENEPSMLTLKNIIFSDNLKDSWTKNVYWRDSSMDLISNIDMLSDSINSKITIKYNKIYDDIKMYFDILDIEHSIKWDDLIKEKISNLLHQYRDGLNLEKRFKHFESIVLKNLKATVNYDVISSYVDFREEKECLSYMSLDYSFFNNSKGKIYKFYNGESCQNYINNQWTLLLNSYNQRLKSLEDDYRKNTNKKIIDFVDRRFNDYINKENIENKLINFKTLFTNQCKEFIEQPICAESKKTLEDNYDCINSEIDNMYSKLNYDYFYPKESKKNPYFDIEYCKKHLEDKLNNLITDYLDEIDDLLEEYRNEWDIRVFEYQREFYSRLLDERVKSETNKITNTNSIKEYFFKYLDNNPTYNIDNFVYLKHQLSFDSKITKAVDLNDILYSNPVQDNLTFYLDLEMELTKNYSNFVENLFSYMDDELRYFINLFKYEEFIESHLYRGKKSRFIADKLNYAFNSYTLDKEGALL